METYTINRKVSLRQELQALIKQAEELKKAYDSTNEYYYLRMLRANALKQEELNSDLHFQEDLV